jgi:hypothetical protein
MKPRGRINTPAKAQAAREFLGLSKSELARVLRLGTNGRETVRRVESDQGPTGPYQLALEALVSGWRPWRVKLPIDKEGT